MVCWRGPIIEARFCEVRESHPLRALAQSRHLNGEGVIYRRRPFTGLLQDAKLAACEEC